MSKTILITGATDGIGFETAKELAEDGHRVIVHGRSSDKLEAAHCALAGLAKMSLPRGHLADFSKIADVNMLADALLDEYEHLDVIVNNAGVYKVKDPQTELGIDVRFVVNTIAPYLLSKRLLPLLTEGSRVVNLASAAQAPVSLDALAGKAQCSDQFNAYAQSKSALIMWTKHLSTTLPQPRPIFIALNPGSLLATKMVREGFGAPAQNMSVGIEVMKRAALSDEFSSATGQYFDNDAGRFARPEYDAMDMSKCAALVKAIDSVLLSCR